jgi:transcriptional regulator with XRE-family HTH domain
LSSEIFGKLDKFMINLEYSKRIKAILKELDLTQVALASKLGLSQGVISEFSSGAREPSKEFIFGLSKLGISVDWFLTGTGGLLLTALASKTTQTVVKTDNDNFKVPLLRQKVSCGPGTNWEDEQNIVDYIDLFSGLPQLKIKRLFALCVEGSSMLGAGIRNGDYVLFDARNDQRPRDGTYVFALDGDVYCKRLEFDMTKIKIFSVRFTDLDKSELMVTLDAADMMTADRFTIFGRVVYCVHPSLDDN